MFSFLSNFFTGKTLVKDIIENWGNKPIVSCVLGISKIGGPISHLGNSFVHSAILLLNTEIDYNQEDDDKFQNENGILIEYGNYSPNMSQEEKKNVNNCLVIYRYGDKGGLKYYGKKYSEFIEGFADIGYIHLNIDGNNQQTFEQFINKIAPLEDNKWIQENYSIGLNNNYNSQTFVIQALKELKPHFNICNVFTNNLELSKKLSQKRLGFLPSNIKTELMNYFRK